MKEREAAFPMGLNGQPSYLNDQIEGITYVATDLGEVGRCAVAAAAAGAAPQ